MSKVIFLPKELAHGFDVVKSYNAYRRWKALAEEDISPEVIFRAGAQWAAMQLGEMIVNDPQFNNIEIHFVEDKMKAQYDFIASEVP